jgi:hypothetical protein
MVQGRCSLGEGSSSLALDEREAATQDSSYLSDPDGYFSKVASS